MSFSVTLGLLLALITALRLGRRVPVQVPGRSGGCRRSIADAPAAEHGALFRSPLYALGIVIAMAGWGPHVGALSLAPISLVQSVIAGGLVLLTVVADRLFGIEVTRREWIGGGADRCRAGVLGRDAGSGFAQLAHRTTTAGTLAIYVAALGVDRARDRGAAEAGRGARGIGRAAVGGIRHVDQGAQLSSGQLGFGVLVHPLAFVILVASLLGLLDLRAQPSARRRGNGDCAHERGREPYDDRCRADRVRRAAAAGWSRAHGQPARVRARDHRGGAHAAARPRPAPAR